MDTPTSTLDSTSTRHGLLMPSLEGTSTQTSLATQSSVEQSASRPLNCDPASAAVPAPPPTPSPPVGIPKTYRAQDALKDIPGTAHALELFLASKMVESEEYCDTMDPKKERLYFSTGFSLIQCVKGFMSYEDEDLLSALTHCKHGHTIATKHRKVAGAFSGLTSRLWGGSGEDWITGMTNVERHAELVYAESLFEKALLGVVYSGDWLSFIKEALNMRSTITVYRALGQFVTNADARHPSGRDPNIDEHFRSGVDLGNGCSHLVLSLLPARLAAVIELFGYKGDRDLGLKLLMRPGGWGEGEEVVSAEKEGVRRTVCDMILLIFHLVISSFTFEGVNMAMARRILDWNLRRYPTGVFFLFGAGRLSLMRSRPAQAIAYYNQAMAVQSQYRNLHHISFWENAIANLALWEVKESYLCWEVLSEEATWSKSIYAYGTAICALQLSTTATSEKEAFDLVAEAKRLMGLVPTLRQRIAGKSIPLEKFVARKARKFLDQGNRLILPALELAYIFLAIAHAPRRVIVERMLQETDAALKSLEEKRQKISDHGKSGKVSKKSKDQEQGLGQAYWDDWCLAAFLKGVCFRYIAFPDPDAEVDPEEKHIGLGEGLETKEKIGEAAKKAFEEVFKYGPKIELDHHLVYHAHYELGRLLVLLGDVESGKHHFELVLSGKPLEVSLTGKKGKYSLENALHMRTFAAHEALTLAHEAKDRL